MDAEQPGAPKPWSRSSIPLERESDPAQEALVRALRSSFNVLRVVLVVLIAAYALSGWFNVKPGYQGLVARFGRLRVNQAQGEYHGRPVFGPGWHIALPDPFDEKLPISGQTRTLLIDTFCFKRQPEDIGKPLAELMKGGGLKPGLDGAMLTGDKNLSHGLWSLIYHVADAERFVRNIGERPETLEGVLRRLTESAVVQVVASRRVEGVTGEEIGDVTAAVKRRVQEALDTLEAGVTVDDVVAETINPPQVRDAFLSVSQAENDSRREIKNAEQKAAETLNQAAGQDYGALLEQIRAYGAAQITTTDEPRLEELKGDIDRELHSAGGQVAVRLREARARANAVRERVRRESEEFTYLLESFKQQPRVTAVRLWVDLLDQVFASKKNEVFFLPGEGAIEILTNRDPQRLIEADLERYRQRFEQSGPQPRR